MLGAEVLQYSSLTWRQKKKTSKNVLFPWCFFLKPINIWVNYNTSLTWNKASYGDHLPEKKHDSSERERWGLYILPRYMYIHIYIVIWKYSHPGVDRILHVNKSSLKWKYIWQFRNLSSAGWLCTMWGPQDS